MDPRMLGLGLTPELAREMQEAMDREMRQLEPVMAPAEKDTPWTSSNRHERRKAAALARRSAR